MNFDYSQLFNGMTTDTSIVLLVILLIAFLFGILFGFVSRGKRVRQLKRELKANNETLEAAKKSVAQRTEQLELKEADLQKARLEASDLHSRLDRLEADNGQMYSELSVAKNQAQKFRSTNQTYADTIEHLQSELSKAKQHNNDLNEEINTGEQSLGQLAEMQSLYGATRNKLQDLENKLNRLEAENNVLQSELGLIKEQQQSDIAAPTFDEAALRPESANVIDKRIEITPPTNKDDLTLINGVGPFIEKKLNEINIYTYEQISHWDSRMIQYVTDKIQFFPGRIQQDNWVEQAARLHQAQLEDPIEFSGNQRQYSSDPKDLTIIDGINTKIEAILHTNKIQTWTELATTELERLKRILRNAGEPFNQADPTMWAEQARLASNGEWERLRRYQDVLANRRND